MQGFFVEPKIQELEEWNPGHFCSLKQVESREWKDPHCG